MLTGRDRKKLAILISAVLIVIFIAANRIHLRLLEGKARDAVEKHLECIVTGKGNPYETVDVLRVNSILQNVSDFLYLDTVGRERVKEKTMVIDRNMYESSFRNSYKDYDEFIDGMKIVYGREAKQTKDGLIVKRNEHHYEFEFLYYVTLTDRLGQKISKKYIFDVRPSIISGSDYAVTGFHEEG
jgi:hypothetical protein